MIKTFDIIAFLIGAFCFFLLFKISKIEKSYRFINVFSVCLTQVILLSYLYATIFIYVKIVSYEEKHPVFCLLIGYVYFLFIVVIFDLLVREIGGKYEYGKGYKIPERISNYEYIVLSIIASVIVVVHTLMFKGREAYSEYTKMSVVALCLVIDRIVSCVRDEEGRISKDKIISVVSELRYFLTKQKVMQMAVGTTTLVVLLQVYRYISVDRIDRFINMFTLSFVISVLIMLLSLFAKRNDKFHSKKEKGINEKD